MSGCAELRIPREVTMEPSDDFARGLTSEKVRAAYNSWKELRAGRIGPRRDEITPARLRAVLPSTFTIDVIDGGKDFRFRFAGDRIIQFMGQRYAGTLLSEKRGHLFFDNMNRLFERCVAAKGPVSSGPVQASLQGKEFLEIEALVLPLSEDGASITGLFGAFDSWQLGTHTSTG
jgi:hypothetical protein